MTDELEAAIRRGNLYRARALALLRQVSRWRNLSRDEIVAFEAATNVIARKMEQVEAESQRAAAAERQERAWHDEAKQNAEERDAAERERGVMKPVVTAALEWFSAQTKHGIEFDTIMEFEHELMMAVEKYRAARLPGAGAKAAQP